MANNPFPYINLAVSFMPSTAFPIDARGFFTDMDEMRAAALTAVEAGSEQRADSMYYFGQLLTYKSPNALDAELYKIVKSPVHGKGILAPISSLTQQQIQEIVDQVVEDPRIVKIGTDVDNIINPKPDSGIVYNNTENSLMVNLTQNSGLKITESGLEINPSDNGNVKLLKDESGLKGEFSWKEF